MASEIFNACLGPPGWSRRRCICRRRRRRWALRPPSSTSWDSRTRSPWADQGGRFRRWPQPSWVLRCWWVRSRREDWDALKPESVRKRSFFEWRPVRSQEMTNFFETSRKINDRQRPLKFNWSAEWQVVRTRNSPTLTKAAQFGAQRTFATCY